VFEPIEKIPNVPFPFPWSMRDVNAAQEDADFLRSQGIDAVFSGDGGDELFYSNGPLPTAVDFAWLHGIRPRLISVALDDALCARSSIWRVLRMVCDYGILRRSWHVRDMIRKDHQPLILPKMKQRAREDLDLWHPLYREESNTPPSKLAHAYMVSYGSCNAYVPLHFDCKPVAIAPLKSQPLMELSLRTPLYVLRDGGRDRALARRAFSADLPREIVDRRSKSYGNLDVQRSVAHNMSLARELLLDGFLVREGFVDRLRLEEVISGRLTTIQSGIVEICTYLDVEAWIRSLQNHSVQAAA
jgi:asparagine synthase (glutamine-hydrolysing)